MRFAPLGVRHRLRHRLRQNPARDLRGGPRAVPGARPDRLPAGGERGPAGSDHGRGDAGGGRAQPRPGAVGGWDIERILEIRARLREQLAELVSVDPAQVALTSSTTDGCNIVLAGLDLEPEDEVVTTTDEHFGLLGPLRASGANVVVVQPDPDRIVSAVTPRTRLLALSHVLWTTGQVLPVRELRDRTGLPILVDGAQSVGAIPADGRGLDFLTISGQKWLCGPEATGALVVADPERFAPRGRATSRSSRYDPDGAFDPWPGARRFEPTWVPAAQMSGLIAALDAAPDWRFERAEATAERCRELLRDAGRTSSSRTGARRSSPGGPTVSRPAPSWRGSPRRASSSATSRAPGSSAPPSAGGRATTTSSVSWRPCRVASCASTSTPRPDPADLRGRGLARRPRPRGGRRQPARRLRRDARGARALGVVVLPDVRGLYRFYEEVALRFAERGYAAIAFDYFGRTAGAEKRGDDFEYMPHVEQTTPEGVQADVAAAVGHLRDAGCERVFTVGFCFGGRNSWLAAASGHGLAGAIGFYGRPGEGRPLGTPGPIQRASEIDGADPRAAGRRRPGHPGRGLEGVRRGARRRPASSTRS